ncbi:uncharacterized protein EDB91DRAFT_1083817 [Suillus paluster]|uniref:uncharacterized protein n=1 Tax=Suillus paluster TaxID=48578 RepID=UPI001B86B2D4|nr:uncharacterized protein EDB91DRAFT_1083817 [Suillus paluster]KAG1735073.1 hypothetical protein EDB91DRAFT_1083817 [Suillus paluster]
MSKKEQFIAKEVEPIQQDLALEYSLEMGFDLMEHSASLLQDELNDITSIPWNEEFDPDEYLEADSTLRPFMMGTSWKWKIRISHLDQKMQMTFIMTVHWHPGPKNNEAVVHNVRRYLVMQKLGTITPSAMCRHVNKVIALTLGLTGPNSHISECTAETWLKKLGYTCKSVWKGIYHDGHERDDVVEAWKIFLEKITRLMAKYDNQTLIPIPPSLTPDEQEHVLVTQDESIFHTNEHQRRSWLCSDDQALKRKGNGRKNHKANWDLPQLQTQMVDTINIFEFLHPNKVAVFIFDCSSAHKGLAANALNVNNMNVKGGSKQSHLHDTIIPLNNPPPKPGQPDTRGMPRQMVYLATHPDPKLAGKPKGMKAVLQEQQSVWDTLMEWHKGKVVGKCQRCQKSQAKRDAEQRFTLAEALGQEAPETGELQAEEDKPETDLDDNWCCIKGLDAQQAAFAVKKYHSHHCVGLATEILTALDAETASRWLL